MKIDNIKKRLISGVLSATLLLSGCSSTPYSKTKVHNDNKEYSLHNLYCLEKNNEYYVCAKRFAYQETYDDGIYPYYYDEYEEYWDDYDWYFEDEYDNYDNYNYNNDDNYNIFDEYYNSKDYDDFNYSDEDDDYSFNWSDNYNEDNSNNYWDDYTSDDTWNDYDNTWDSYDYDNEYDDYYDNYDFEWSSFNAKETTFTHKLSAKPKKLEIRTHNIYEFYDVVNNQTICYDYELPELGIHLSKVSDYITDEEASIYNYDIPTSELYYLIENEVEAPKTLTRSGSFGGNRKQ